MENELKLPVKNTKFKIESFFQLDVDAFEDGYFLFLSTKQIYIKTDKFLKDETISVNNKGWVISTYCYTNKSYHKILVCRFNPIPWHNCYRIQARLASVNGCDGYSVSEEISEVLSWFDFN